MPPPISTRPNFSSHQEASISFLSLSVRGKTEWKPQSQKTNQTDHMESCLTMKLWAMPCRATQNRRVMVKSSDKMWSTGEGNGKPLQYSCLENHMNSMKRQNDRTLKDELPRSVLRRCYSNMLLEISGEITPERMKRWDQRKNSTQLKMWLLMEIKSDVVQNNIA